MLITNSFLISALTSKQLNKKIEYNSIKKVDSKIIFWTLRLKNAQYLIQKLTKTAVINTVNPQHQIKPSIFKKIAYRLRNVPLSLENYT